MKLKFYPLLILSFITQLSFAKDYKGAEIYSSQSWLYGKIEVRMKVAKASGILSTFFTYKNGSEISGTKWEEIDIEVLGKNNAQTFQSNIISGYPKKTSEMLHNQNFSLADDYHTYGLEWTPDYVAWFFDGKEVRRTTGDQVKALVNPQSFRFNLWAANISAWVGTFNGASLPVYQYVNWISYSSYTPGKGDKGTDFTFSWKDDFDFFDSSRWNKANWTFGENLADFAPENVNVVNGYLVLALTKRRSKINQLQMQ
jgi:beta-glucanase (GH16 family)